MSVCEVLSWGWDWTSVFLVTPVSYYSLLLFGGNIFTFNKQKLQSENNKNYILLGCC